jgi:hypothetical protein
MKNRSTSNSARAINSRGNALKSLLTLASGAASLGALAPAAEAGIIHYTPFSPNKTVGFGGGQLPDYSFNLPGTASITLNRETNTLNNSNRIVAVIVGGAFARQSNSRSAAPSPPGTNVALRTAYGKNWDNAASSERADAAAFGNIIQSTITSNFRLGPAAFSDPPTKYLLFQFQNAGTTEYGWIGMSGATYTGDKSGMSVTFTGWAYEDSGLKINAGDMGVTPVPEASTGVVGALVAAMVVGGVELRRWRKSKPANVSQPG